MISNQYQWTCHEIYVSWYSILIWCRGWMLLSFSIKLIKLKMSPRVILKIDLFCVCRYMFNVFTGSTTSSRHTAAQNESIYIISRDLRIGTRGGQIWWICMHGPTPTNRQAHRPEDQKLKEQGWPTSVLYKPQFSSSCCWIYTAGPHHCSYQTFTCFYTYTKAAYSCLHWYATHTWGVVIIYKYNT
jgi:hypothetical protein